MRIAILTVILAVLGACGGPQTQQISNDQQHVDVKIAGRYMVTYDSGTDLVVGVYLGSEQSAGQLIWRAGGQQRSSDVHLPVHVVRWVHLSPGTYSISTVVIGLASGIPSGGGSGWTVTITGPV